MRHIGLTLAIVTVLMGGTIMVGASAIDWTASSALTLMPHWAELVIGGFAAFGGVLVLMTFVVRRLTTVSLMLRRVGVVLATPGLMGYALVVATAPQHASVAAAILTAGIDACLWWCFVDAAHIERAVRRLHMEDVHGE